MDKDEALKLALEFVSDIQRGKYKGDAEEVITAIKQALALDKKAENARELGLDYEPVLKDNSNYRYDPPVAEPDAYMYASIAGPVVLHRMKPMGVATAWCVQAQLENDIKVSKMYPLAHSVTPLYTTPPAAQRQWVGLSQNELDAMFSNTIKGKKLVNWFARAIEAKLKEKNT
jgi:hypothetical protein